MNSPPNLPRHFRATRSFRRCCWGRLARDVNFPGVGRLLLLDALARSLRHAEQVAAAAVLVDAKNENARQFYAKYGSKRLHSTRGGCFLADENGGEATGGVWLSNATPFSLHGDPRYLGPTRSTR